MPLNFRALSSFGFSSPLLLFFFSFFRCFRYAAPIFWPQMIRSGCCLNFCKPSQTTLLGDVGIHCCALANQFLFAPMFQQSSIRFSCNTSRFVCVVLVTSVCFVELGMFLLSARRTELEVRHDDENYSSPRLTENHCGFCIIFCFVCRLRLLRISLKVSTELCASFGLIPH